MSINVDLAIIGGGPGGYTAAERAGNKGLSVALIEKRELGGVCLNEGCIPTKALLYTAKLYEHAAEGSKYGINANDVSLDYGKMMARKQKIVKRLVGGVATAMKQNNVQVFKSEGFIKGRSASGITITAGEEEIIAANLLICTGSDALMPPIPGLSGPNDVILTSRELLELTERPESLVIIGGGVVGMEFGSFFNSIGAKITIIEMMDEILTGMDLEMSTMLRQNLAKKGITFHLASKVTEVKGNEVIFQKEGKTESVSGEKILISVGRKPVTKGFGLENLGVELFRGGIKVDEKMRTNVPNVFAAGDITGFSLLAHTAYREGEVVVNNLTGRNDRMRYDAIPAVVYTNPEFSGVGLTEESAKEKKIEYKSVKLPMTYAGRFMIENEGVSGLCKILVGAKYKEVLGVHMLGNTSSELMYGASMAIEMEMTLKEMQEVIFPHPTISEIIRETVFAFH